METIFIKRYIKSKDDLPKVEGDYFAKYKKEQGDEIAIFYCNPKAESNINDWIRDTDYWLEEKPPPTDEECVHPYHSVIGGDGQPEKCLKCGEILNQ